MSFKQLSGRRKLANLGERVVALAPLEGGRLVAAITTDPVRLSIHPFSGNNRVTHVSLDEADEVAMIDKSVAVAKSGDDLWALLDIQHSTKIEQVGRDVRSLHARPTGGTALAVGWDGQGVELAFRTGDVEARPFVLRGELRAASLTGDRCYVVAEGAGGGQLREHPGATPESAAVARADLPQEAASFDLLRGGEALSALTKRGADVVCTAVRRGDGLTAAMLPVSGGVQDLAVIDSSLAALCGDGRVRLYDGDAVAAAAGPTAELGVDGAGAPTAICVTRKGGAKLWIGTAGGDVVRCDVVRGELEL